MRETGGRPTDFGDPRVRESGGRPTVSASRMRRWVLLQFLQFLEKSRNNCYNLYRCKIDVMIKTREALRFPRERRESHLKSSRLDHHSRRRAYLCASPTRCFLKSPSFFLLDTSPPINLRKTRSVTTFDCYKCAIVGGDRPTHAPSRCAKRRGDRPTGRSECGTSRVATR